LTGSFSRRKKETPANGKNGTHDGEKKSLSSGKISGRTKLGYFLAKGVPVQKRKERAVEVVRKDNFAM